MRKGFKALLCLVPLGVAWFALGESGLLPRIPDAQRVALELIRRPDPALPGRNAILAALLISRGVPRAEWARYQAMAPTAAVASLQEMEAAPDATRDTLPECQAWGNGCLARVRADLAVTRKLRDGLAWRLALIDVLQRDYAHAAVIGGWSLDTPIPPLNGLHAPVRLDASLRFVDGDHAGALQELCAHARYWRDLRRNTDLLFGDMVGVAYLSGAANTYAEMLAQLPGDVEPPAACAAAFAPLIDAEFEQCRVFKTEFAGLATTLRDRYDADEGTQPTWLRRALIDAGMQLEPTLALAAPSYAVSCEAAQRQRIARREDMAALPPQTCSLDGWLFNPLGCIVGGLGPSYDDYYHRLLDLDGRLRLVSSAAWLHANAAGDPAAAFAQRPPALHDPRHRLEGEHCAPMLGFEPRVPRPWDSDWQLSLAPPADCASAALTATAYAH